VVKKRENKLFQWCMCEHRVEEILQINKELCIEEMTFEVGMSYRRMNKPIPPRLRELGVLQIREPILTVEASGMLTGSRTAMLKASREICKELTLDIRHMRVRRLRVSWKNDAVTFTRVTKNMIGDDGKTERLAMLGLVLRDDLNVKAVNTIIKKLSADKIHCKYGVTTTRTVVCSK